MKPPSLWQLKLIPTWLGVVILWLLHWLPLSLLAIIGLREIRRRRGRYRGGKRRAVAMQRLAELQAERAQLQPTR